MRLPVLATALLTAGALAASAEEAASPDGGQLFSTICLDAAPELREAQVAAATGEAVGGMADAHVEARDGRFCELRLGPGPARPAITRGQADALVGKFADRVSGTILGAEDQGQGFSYRVTTGGSQFIVLLKNEGPKQFFMIKSTGR